MRCGSDHVHDRGGKNPKERSLGVHRVGSELITQTYRHFKTGSDSRFTQLICHSSPNLRDECTYPSVYTDVEYYHMDSWVPTPWQVIKLYARLPILTADPGTRQPAQNKQTLEHAQLMH